MSSSSIAYSESGSNSFLDFVKKYKVTIGIVAAVLIVIVIVTSVTFTIRSKPDSKPSETPLKDSYVVGMDGTKLYFNTLPFQAVGPFKGFVLQNLELGKMKRITGIDCNNKPFEARAPRNIVSEQMPCPIRNLKIDVVNEKDLTTLPPTPPPSLDSENYVIGMDGTKMVFQTLPFPSAGPFKELRVKSLNEIDSKSFTYQTSFETCGKAQSARHKGGLSIISNSDCPTISNVWVQMTMDNEVRPLPGPMPLPGPAPLPKPILPPTPPPPVPTNYVLLSNNDYITTIPSLPFTAYGVRSFEFDTTTAPFVTNKQNYLQAVYTDCQGMKNEVKANQIGYYDDKCILEQVTLREVPPQ
jgi:hypothetical protein